MSVTIEEPAPIRQPALHQQRSDAALGYAIRRCVAALPAGWYFTTIYINDQWSVTAVPTALTADRSITTRATQLVDALDDLSGRLEAAGCQHDWRQHCIRCGGER